MFPDYEKKSWFIVGAVSQLSFDYFWKWVFFKESLSYLSLEPWMNCQINVQLMPSN